MPLVPDDPHQVQLRPFGPDDLDAVVALSLRAWEPFFSAFPELVGTDLAEWLHPDFHGEQTEVVTDGCTNPAHHTAVASVDGAIVGFAVVVLDPETSIGELHLLAVDPAHQRQGIATILNEWALEVMRSHGMRMAKVGTGGDRSHAPARRSYERAGYTSIPVVQYFKLLQP